MVLSSILGDATTKRLAAFLRVGPLELHSVHPELLGLPGADVPDLAVRIVIPAGAGHGVGNGLTQLMRARRCQGIQHGE
jgi:hypothetical protein